jgi:hypothetical protein
MMARIRVSDDKEFSLLLTTLSSDIGWSQFHYKLLRDLQNARDSYPEVFNETRTFWYLTFQAHETATLYRLNRVFDQEKEALSLVNWLMTIKTHLYLFDEANFRQRLQGNEFVDSLARSFRKPDEHELNQDIKLVWTKDKSNKKVDPIVKKYVDIRNKYLAHVDPSFLLPSCGIQPLADLTWDDIEHMLNLASKLLNKYSSLFSANLYSGTIIGHDDYKYIIETINMRIMSYKAVIDAETKKYLNK